MLSLAAARGPKAYQRWIAHTEPAIFENFISLTGPERTLRLMELSFASGDLETNGTAGLADRLSADDRLGDAVESLADNNPDTWLMPKLFGDSSSPLLERVLPEVVAGSSATSLIYWDEDRVVDGRRDKPWIKPNWDSLLFRQLGGLAGASIVPLKLFVAEAQKHPELRADRAGVETILMGIATNPSFASPVHVPLILTHRDGATALNVERYRALKVELPSDDTWPKVSVILPTRDQPKLLRCCLEGLERTKYPGEMELIIVDNGSVDPEALHIIEEAKLRDRAVILRDEGPFNYSKLNNHAAAVASGAVLCLINNDVEPIDADWLEIMVCHAMGHDVGAVGAQLRYPSGRIQHAGVAVGLGGAAGHVQKRISPNDERHWPWHRVSREVSALTAAVLVIQRERYLSAGGFDEEAFPVAFNDVDFCLRLKNQGFRNLYIAEARLIHHESESRGDDKAPENAERFQTELKSLRDRWGTQEYEDPHFSPLFSKLTEQCLLVS